MKRFSENVPSERYPDWRVTLVLDNLRSAHNVGNILRIAEALQLEVIACGYTPCPPHPVVAKTAMDCDKLVPCRSFGDTLEALATLRREGCQMILALEHNQSSSEVWSLEQVTMPLALVLGNEALGISPQILAQCDRTVDLPMLGSKASINVGNAAAAALYAIYAKYKEQLKI